MRQEVRALSRRGRVGAALAGSVLVLMGCRGGPYRTARELYELGAYDVAHEHIQAGLKKNPKDRKLQELDKLVRLRSAGKHMDAAAGSLEKGDYDGASFELGVASEREPGSKAAAYLLDAAKGHKDRLAKGLGRARGLAEKKQWDEAARELASLRSYEKTCPDVRVLRRHAAAAGVREHLEKFRQALRAGDLETAGLELEGAAAICPDSEEYAECRATLAERRRIAALLADAAKVCEAGRHAEAQKLYDQALAADAESKPALAGRARCLAALADVPYEKAREHENRATKTALAAALESYLACAKIRPDHRDAARRIDSVKRRLAEIWFDEAEHLIEQPELARAHLARLCYERAAALAADLPRLKQRLARAAALARIKSSLHVRVHFTGAEPLGERLGKAVCEAASRLKAPHVDCRLGDTAGLKETLDAEARRHGYPPEGLARRYGVLAIEGEVRRDKTFLVGHDKPVHTVSVCVLKREPVPNPPHEVHRVEGEVLVLAKGHLSALAAAVGLDLQAARRARDEGEAAFRAAKARFDTADESFQAASTRVDQVRARISQLERELRSARQALRQAKAPAAAAGVAPLRARVRRLEADLGRLQHDLAVTERRVNALRTAHSHARTRLAEADARFADDQAWLDRAEAGADEVDKASASTQRRLDQAQHGLGATPSTEDVEHLKPYHFLQYVDQVFGQVAVNVRATMPLRSQVLRRWPVHKVADHKKTLRHAGIRGDDRGRVATESKPIPAPPAMLAQLRTQLLKNVATTLGAFFDTYHRRHLADARRCKTEGRVRHAMEHYLAYLAARHDEAEAKDVQEARSFVDERAAVPLR